MKVMVLGSGVVGTTTAYYLAQAGHEVTVIDRQCGPGLETSFANAGEISPGYASPWAAPGVPLKAIKWLLAEHSPLVLHARFDREMLRWLLGIMRNCTTSRYSVNKERMARLAEFSRQCLIDLRHRTKIQYDQRARGTLQLFRTASQLDSIGKDVDLLRAGGVPFEILDRAGCIAAEPGLAASEDTFVGGLRLPLDETGDCFKFTAAVAKLAETLGVQFRFSTAITGIANNRARIEAIKTTNGLMMADCYVVALGSYSTQMVRALGLQIPVYPVKGYSITAPVANEDLAPVSTLMDETYKVAITRLGKRVRVGGIAELAGFNGDLPQRRRRTLEHSVTSLFPGAADFSAASFWSGLRPMTPDGTPVIGRTSFQNLYLNTGHGTLGWTMACGSAKVLSDLISDRSPEIDTSDLSIARYRPRPLSAEARSRSK